MCIYFVHFFHPFFTLRCVRELKLIVSFSSSEVSNRLLFLLYPNQRPRMSYFFLFYLNQRARMSILFLFLLYPRPRTNVFSLNRKIAPRRITIAGQSELTANITKFTKRCCVYHPGLLGSSFGFFSISSAGMGQR